ncbi:MAG: hypothetical protein HUK09_08115, partial [Bacteroidaceae bacterium]|nr:hypothetical protein [Bacteroidaceae bacterium]
MARGLKGRGVFSPVFVDVRDGADGLNGQNGRDGKDGAGVQSVQEQWYLSKSHTILDGGAWDSARPQMQPYTYLWRKSWQK